MNESEHREVIPTEVINLPDYILNARLNRISSLLEELEAAREDYHTVLDAESKQRIQKQIKHKKAEIISVVEDLSTRAGRVTKYVVPQLKVFHNIDLDQWGIFEPEKSDEELVQAALRSATELVSRALQQVGLPLSQAQIDFLNKSVDSKPKVERFRFVQSSDAVNQALFSAAASRLRTINDRWDSSYALRAEFSNWLSKSLEEKDGENEIRNWLKNMGITDAYVLGAMNLSGPSYLAETSIMQILRDAEKDLSRLLVRFYNETQTESDQLVADLQTVLNYCLQRGWIESPL